VRRATAAVIPSRDEALLRLLGDPHRIPRQHVAFRLASIRLRVFAEARMLGLNIQPLSRRTGHDGGRVGPRRMGRAIAAVFVLAAIPTGTS
jgi:hypothetical protein